MKLRLSSLLHIPFCTRVSYNCVIRAKYSRVTYSTIRATYYNNKRKKSVNKRERQNERQQQQKKEKIMIYSLAFFTLVHRC